MSKKRKSVNSITHKEEKRTNIPTAEYENLMLNKDKKPIELKYPRNPDLDPQLVWRGKDDQDLSDLVVTAPPIYIQEKINPKHIIDDLMNQSKKRVDKKTQEETFDLFADMFDGKLDPKSKTEFYAHDQNWTNRMILGDSLQVMASLSEREGLRGKVQCIYLDPPYGINFSSNFQPDTQQNTAGNDNVSKLTREPEMVKAFRDTWLNGINSYLSYLRDRLMVSYDLLSQNGSIFFQISDENLHLVRNLLDEIFGHKNFIAIIPFRKKTMPFGTNYIEQMGDFIVWYAKQKYDSDGKPFAKYRKLYREMNYENSPSFNFSIDEYGLPAPKSTSSNGYLARNKSLEPSGKMPSGMFEYEFQGKLYSHPKNGYATTKDGMDRLFKASRIVPSGNYLNFLLKVDDKKYGDLTAPWVDTSGADGKIYVVQTNTEIVKRCILMASDPGDLVLDPTCGSGTTAFVSENWGRRWITIDSSRVALTLARKRLMSAKYPAYFLKDSDEGRKLEFNEFGTSGSNSVPTREIRQGFVYKRFPHTTLKSITDNTEIDEIYLTYEDKITDLLNQIKSVSGNSFNSWDVPRDTESVSNPKLKNLFERYWKIVLARQSDIDKSILINSDFHYLFDQPFEDNSKTRVTGPFTVESLSPHKVMIVDDNGEFITKTNNTNGLHVAKEKSYEIDFGNMILQHLRTAGVQQAHKEDRIKFTSINPFPGQLISGDGRYLESKKENSPQKRAAIFIGPEYGTLGRADIVAAASEALDLNFDILVCCAFNYDALSSEIDKLTDMPILKARMNPDLHMADELKNTGKGNLFIVFGEPDIDFIDNEDGKIQIKIHGVDVFHPSKGEVVSGGPESIAAWFIDTNYNEESFFVRHAYFLGANDPYKQLKRALKAEIDEEAWKSLYCDISRSFPKPDTGRVAVKVINHLGDEVMKVFKID